VLKATVLFDNVKGTNILPPPLPALERFPDTVLFEITAVEEPKDPDSMPPEKSAWLPEMVE